MSIIARFRAIEENDKAAAVRKLMQSSTPNFDFFYLVVLSVMMATLGLLLNSASIVIGSMLIAPLLYPILAMALGLVMSNTDILTRSTTTLIRSLLLSLTASVFVTVFFTNIVVIGDVMMIHEIMSRTQPNIGHLMVAVIAGAAVAFAIAQPEWSETLPGIAISVALIPPLAVIGIGIATWNVEVATGSTVLFILNLIGIIFSAMVTFSLMNLYEKANIAASTIKREEEKLAQEKAAIAEVESKTVDKKQEKLQNDTNEESNQ